MTQLRLSHLTKTAKHKTLLREVNLSLEAHHIYGLIGGNGAGKTTLFRCILGLSFSRGDIYWDHHLVTPEDQAEFLRKVGVVFPFPDSFDALTVAEVVDEHVWYYGCPPVAVEDYLERFGLMVASGAKLSTFSLGMKQRLNMALAFLHDPEIVLLDEPFNGLDREGIALLQDLLVVYKKQGKLIVVSSHSFAELEAIIDRVIMIDEGAIQAVSDLEELAVQGKGLADIYQDIKGGR